MTRKNLDLAITEVVQSIGLVVRRARAAADSHDLSWSEASVLKRLARDEASTTADLARVEGMRPQSMRPIVAALENAGMIRRKPHPTDGRQVNLELTAKGAAAQTKMREERRSWLEAGIARLDQREQETLFEAARILKKLAEGDRR